MEGLRDIVGPRGKFRNSRWWETTGQFRPFQVRSGRRQVFEFGDQVFPADTTIESAYRLYEFRGTYFYNLLPADSPWWLEAGGGLSYQYTSVELLDTEMEQFEKADDGLLLPILSASVGYSITPQFKLFAQLDGMDVSGDKLLDSVGAHRGRKRTTEKGFVPTSSLPAAGFGTLAP